MNFLRIIAFPVSVLYQIITAVRNFLYDIGWFKSYSFDLSIIAVGNLSVGGTGKTPQIEYLIRLLSDKYRIATLSRGYKRQSAGFILADESATASSLGDEPFQYYQKFKNIQVAVDASRKNGIQQLLLQVQNPEIILLDDAFQHRKVKAGFYILLTNYDDLYSDDFVLPTGNLRESSNGAKRANLIIVTKCPKNISVTEQNSIKLKLNITENQQLFFGFTEYDDFISSETKSFLVANIINDEYLLLAGIAKPEPFFEHLQNEKNSILSFPDHHNFSDKDISDIKNKANNRKIITTEKDFVRLRGKISDEQLFYLPIKSNFVADKENFDKIILDYVGKSSRNS